MKRSFKAKLLRGEPVILFVLVALLAIWPEIVLWLPEHMTVRP